MMRLRLKSILTGFVFASLLFAGCTPAAPSGGAPAAVKPPAVEQVEVKVYFGTRDAEHLAAEKHMVEKNDFVMRKAMEILIAGPKSPELLAVVPPDAKVRSVTVKERIAYVDFSQEMVKRGFGGSSMEILAVGSIVNTLTEFPEVEGVQILVEGKKVTTLFGHMDIDETLRRSPDIIDKNSR